MGTLLGPRCGRCGRFKRLDCRCEPVYDACDVCHKPVFVDEYGEIMLNGKCVRGHASKCVGDRSGLSVQESNLP